MGAPDDFLAQQAYIDELTSADTFTLTRDEDGLHLQTAKTTIHGKDWADLTSNMKADKPKKAKKAAAEEAEQPAA